MASKINAPKTSRRKPASKPKTARGAAREDERDDDDDIGGEADGVGFNPQAFVKHVGNVGALKSKAASIRDEISSAVKNAEEDHGIHRGASALWIKLHNMNEEARNAYLKAFDDMRTALGYATQSDLFEKPAEAATFGGRVS